ncbi:MAG: CoA transferase [Clostridiales Family XIII bacterium]|jgi:crotonobetainyl-CoA:carnitine CoA-transferase CaiB-like acyl-CoA transferase|nr:CoA transferase [Clostridiales Family XIII bacterium]
MSDSQSSPLSGIKILDLTWVYAGPYCTLLLHDLGADVIKVESPNGGDHTRRFPPFRGGASGYFYSLNRGKKSCILDLKSKEGNEAFLSLVKTADVVTENFAPGVMEKLGIGYNVLKGINPRIIYGSIYGFGSFGPYAGRVSFDPVAQATGGFMSQIGYPEERPIKAGAGIADALSGIYLALGIVAAIHEREHTGRGQRVEVSMQDAIFSVLEESVVRASMTGEALGRRGNLDETGAPWDAFETCDGRWVMVCAVGGKNCASALRMAGRDDLANEYGDEGEEGVAKRIRDLLPINKAFAEWAILRTADELETRMAELRIPCGVVKEVSELLEDPHLKERNMVVDVNHPSLGHIKTYNNPIFFDGESVGLTKGELSLEPKLGADTERVIASIDKGLL